MTRILIIEDNPTTASFLYTGFKEHQLIPDLAKEGEMGLHLAKNHPYDLIVLDIMLPKLNGLAVLQTLRASNVETPIILLTAKDTVADRVRGLELGADDYLVKPFAFSELLARVHRLLRRRVGTPSHTVIIIADLLIDKDKVRAMRAHQVLALSAKEFMLLCLFAQNIGQVLTRTYIAEQVWDIHFDFNTNAIDVAVKRLRQKVDEGHAVKLIHSVRGVGYVMEVR